VDQKQATVHPDSRSGERKGGGKERKLVRNRKGENNGVFRIGGGLNGKEDSKGEKELTGETEAREKLHRGLSEYQTPTPKGRIVI